MNINPYLFMLISMFGGVGVVTVLTFAGLFTGLQIG
jgi:hypothetical protein